MRGDIPTNLARNSVAPQKTTKKSVAELMSDRALSTLYKAILAIMRSIPALEIQESP